MDTAERICLIDERVCQTASGLIAANVGLTVSHALRIARMIVSSREEIELIELRAELNATGKIEAD
jgi:hypothetical protein